MQDAPKAVWSIPLVSVAFFPSLKQNFIAYRSSKVSSSLGRVKNSDDAHFGQIVCDKDGVVDWCIVQLEMPLTRLEECWPFPTKSFPELP